MKGETSDAPGWDERADETRRRSSSLARLAATTALLSALLSGPGCTLILPSYPAQLPRLSPSVGGNTNQPVVAGRYCDEGWKLDGQVRKPADIRLSEMLDSRWTRNGRIDNVTVSGPADDKIQLEVRRGDAVVGAGQLLKSDSFWRNSDKPRTYSTREGFVQMVVSSGSGGGLVVPYLGFFWNERINLLMRRAVDGSLVVLIRDTGEGVVVVVPLLKNKNNWYVFPPYPGCQ